MKVKKLNTHFKKNYKEWSGVDAVEMPDGTFILPNRTVEDPNHEGILNDITIESETEVLPIPEIGEECREGVIYQIETDIDSELSPFVICRQTHNRTEHEVKDIPALFTFHRENADDLEWIPNELIKVGWKRVYNGVTYEAIQGHMTVIGQTPDLVPAIWKAEQTTSEWKQPTGAHDAYQLGDVVTYNGFTWESQYNNNVWAPGVFGWVKI